jgi:hypothetical protein
MHLLNEAVETALNKGYQGLRTCGDMSWLLGEHEGTEQVLQYEAFLNEFFRGVRACGMCLYDQRRIAAAMLDHALATHTEVSVGQRLSANPFYRPPAIAISRIPDPANVDARIRELRRRL